MFALSHQADYNIVASSNGRSVFAPASIGGTLARTQRYLRLRGGAAVSCTFRERASALHWTANAIREILRPAEGPDAGLERLRRFVEQAPVPLGLFGKDMRYLAASNLWKSDRGLESSDLSGKFHCDLFPRASERWREMFRRTFSGETLREEFDLTTRRDGSFQWMSWEMWPCRTPGGDSAAILVLTEYLKAGECLAGANAGGWPQPPFGACEPGQQCGNCDATGGGSHPAGFLSRLQEMIETMEGIERGLGDTMDAVNTALDTSNRPAWTALDRQAAKTKARDLAARAAAVARDALLLSTLFDTAGRVRRGRSLN
jgi:PAS domain S-box-containing protein